MTIKFTCEQCGESYPAKGFPYRCEKCGGVFAVSGFSPPEFKRGYKKGTGIWRFRRTFGLSDGITPITLGEGNTPLVWVKMGNRKVGIKCEFLNPTGSFKDRGSSLIATFLKSRGAMEAVEDSSGNAGASFAAYAARAGIKARIFVPETSSGPKREQIEAYGATLVPVRGSRERVTEEVIQSAKEGFPYASHAFLPFNIPGYATVAYELIEELGVNPGTIILPAGQGGLLLGLAYGFHALRIGNNRLNFPKLIGVQAHFCAPIWNFIHGREIKNVGESHNTIAEGVRVWNPVRIERVLKEIKNSHGDMCIVEEDEIIPARNALAQLGFYVEPTSAIVWPVLQRDLEKFPDPIIVILTGSGFKSG